MRCNRHVSDPSSSIGVCASCLRERLSVLIEAQVEANRCKTESHRKSDAHNQQPLVFPRSVSPYICRRSDDSSWHNNDRRFYSTPQVGPTFGSSDTRRYHSKKKHTGKFSLLSTLFRSSRSVVASEHSTASPISSSSSSTSSSWFSSLLSRKKKHSRFDEAHSKVINQLNRRARDRGMSPTNVDRDFDHDPYDGDGNGLPSGIGYSSESSPGWRKSASVSATATIIPGRRRGAALQNRNVSGLAFCLSPLVRASPNNHRNQKDANLAAVGVFGEIPRKPAEPHISAAASLCANRSRKLADFGRYNYNP